MTRLMERNNITYEHFNLKLLEGTALVVGKAFSSFDPMAVAQRLSVQDFYKHIQLLGRWLAEAGLSIIAKDQESGQVIGALIAGDFAADSPLEMEQISEKFAPIFCLFQSLEDAYKQDKQIDVHEYLHLYMLAVAPQHWGQGIAQTLVSTALSYGAKQGYKTALTEAANPTSQHIFKKADFVPRDEILYGQFTYKGDRVFESITKDVGTVLMDKSLNR